MSYAQAEREYLEVLHRYEMDCGETMLERLWIRWADKCERLMGHSLDGDEKAEGFSLDSACEAFEAGKTPEQYASGWRPSWARS